MAAALLIRVAFPRRAYSGGELGVPEELPSPARLHAAFVAAAAGGPAAEPVGPTLGPRQRECEAVRWLEDNEAIGVIVPRTRPVDYSVRRYRQRVAVDPTHETEVDHRDQTLFEPFCALDGPITFAWPAPAPQIVETLRRLAPEVTHVGRADSTVIVHVGLDDLDKQAPGVLVAAPGRGPGMATRVPIGGRLDALLSAYARASKAGSHAAGPKSKQAADQSTENAGDASTALRRFTPSSDAGAWPFSEAWGVPINGRLPRWALRLDRRVAVAAAIHRAIVAEIGTDVPAFVSGRDGDGPLGGAGHLAIQVVREKGGGVEAVLGLPAEVAEADRAALLEALAARPKVRLGRETVRLGTPAITAALPYWPAAGRYLTTAVPMVLDTAGTPRRGPWTLDDAVVCSVGYALRGVLERDGMSWRTGWSFRQALVLELRERGVDARARRVPGPAARFVHRARPGDLLVAVEALVTLGELAPTPGGLLALGRARHLGGGLLRPLPADA